MSECPQPPGKRLGTAMKFGHVPTQNHRSTNRCGCDYCGRIVGKPYLTGLGKGSPLSPRHCGWMGTDPLQQENPGGVGPRIGRHLEVDAAMTVISSGKEFIEQSLSATGLSAATRRVRRPQHEEIALRIQVCTTWPKQVRFPVGLCIDLFRKFGRDIPRHPLGFSILRSRFSQAIRHLPRVLRHETRFSILESVFDCRFRRSLSQLSQTRRADL
jgi:hypothetical protein